MRSIQRTSHENELRAVPSLGAWRTVSGRAEELERGLLRAVEGLGCLEEAGRHHLLGGGKRLRGRLSLAAGMGLGCAFSDSLPIAIAVELLHNASLVHDDLQDGDRERRGELAVWAAYDRSTALLLGDALIARAFGSLADVPSAQLGPMLRTLASCVAGLARGQGSDGTQQLAIEWTIPAYEELAREKTGLLFALPPALVCTHLHGPGPMAQAASEAFALLGVAFQIYDDLADVTGAKGRAAGSDLRDKRLSAVVLHTRLALAAERAPRPRSTALDGILEGHFDRMPFEEQAERIVAGPGIEATLRHQEDVLERAVTAGRVLPEGLRDVLEDIAEEVRDTTRGLLFRDRFASADAALSQQQV
ncbi:(2E,6E)-farnesyl diphosphate synthase [Planctomycetes bacterium Poly30]|uniref:(2E,6E)-farnesyl diphosphate synthase n=1 Tax=Saltatorellus ferox TaxID=2528018 RepID=A0A518EPC4_9BACT|nr:(2E,6E)-farnesyl diphosphate synthase [Planctomycetes bacterium Poly30]